MQHPVLDAFDRLIAALSFFAEPGMPRAVLLFLPENKVALLGMGAERGPMIPVAALLSSGHKRLAFEAKLPLIVDAAQMYQKALHTIQGLAEVFAGSALAFAYADATDSLRFTWWPGTSLDTVGDVFDGFTKGDVEATALRAALGRAVQAVACVHDSLLPCALIDPLMLDETVVVRTRPEVMAALETLFHQNRHTHVGVRPRAVTQHHAPATYAFGADPHRDAEATHVCQAYDHLVSTLQDAPPCITDALFYETVPCLFYTKNGTDGTEAQRPGARKRPLPGPMFCAPEGDHASWMDRGTEAWHAFVAAFPPGRQWEHTHAFTELDVGQGPASRNTPVVWLHRYQTDLVFSPSNAAAWLAPRGDRAFFVQTSESSGVFRVDADDEAAAVDLACRLCPPRAGFPTSVRLWDVWRATPSPS